MNELKIPQDFFPHWNKDIVVEDNRSEIMPSKSSGKVIGIHLDKVLVQQGNNMITTYPLSPMMK